MRHLVHALQPAPERDPTCDGTPCGFTCNPGFILGFADLIVGADAVGGDIGAVYVYQSTASGLPGAPTGTLSGPASETSRYGSALIGARQSLSLSHSRLLLAAAAAGVIPSGAPAAIPLRRRHRKGATRPAGALSPDSGCARGGAPPARLAPG